MSRTYRKHLVHEYKIRGRYYSDKETNELWDLQSGIWYFSGKRERIDKKPRDRKPKVETMPDFNAKYRVATKYNKYRIEALRDDGKWTGLSVLIDDLSEARKLREKVIETVRNEWIATKDITGWTVVE